MLLFLSSGTFIFEGNGEEKLQQTFTINIALWRHCVAQGMRKTREPFHRQDTQISIWICQDSTDTVKSDIQNC